MKLLCCVLCCLAASTCLAEDYVPGKAIVGIQHDYLNFSADESSASVTAVVTDDGLAQVLNRHGVTEIEEVCPGFAASETLFDAGENVLREPDLSCIYRGNVGTLPLFLIDFDGGGL